MIPLIPIPYHTIHGISIQYLDLSLGVTYLAIDCRFEIVRRLCVLVICSREFPDLLTVCLFTLNWDVFHVDVWLNADDLKFEAHKET